MKKVVIDFETYSSVNLKKFGTRNYAKGDTHIRTIGWKWVGDSETYVISRLLDHCPNAVKKLKTLVDQINKKEVKLIAHNWFFEYNILNEKMNEFLKDFNLKVCRHVDHTEFICTKQLSQIARGPGSLAKAGEYFGLKTVKSAELGKIMKHTMHKLYDINDETADTIDKLDLTLYDLDGGMVLFSEDSERLVEKYCKIDVDVTEALYNITRKKVIEDSGEFIGEIIKGIEMHNKMTVNGIPVDVPKAKKISAISELLEKEQEEYTAPLGIKFNQKAKLLKLLRSKGYKIKGVGAGDIKIASQNNPEKKKINKWLQGYADLNISSLKKANHVIDKSNGGHIYDEIIFCGAATGRWTAKGFQPQNLPRPSCELDEVNTLLDKNSYKGAQSALRTIITAPKDKTFYNPDLSQVEARHALYKAGHLEEMAIMADPDRCLYKETAASIFNKDVADITKDERSQGKVAILSGQYGVGEKSYRTNLQAMTGIKVLKKDAEKVIKSYRSKYSKIVKCWADYDEMLSVYTEGDFKVKLATGRYLNFGPLEKRQFKVDDADMIKKCAAFLTSKIDGKGKKVYYKTNWSYKGSDGNGNVKFMPLWGSRVWQNVIQAECRDILLLKMNAMHDMGYQLVMTVHDETLYLIDDTASCRKQVEIDWNNAGMDKILDIFPGLMVNSEGGCLKHYWK